MEIRTITDDEVESWVAAMREGFLGQAAEGEADFRRPTIDIARTLGAFDGDRVVGTYRSFPTELTLPGGRTVPAAAVTNVTVAPTHRRRRLLTEMMERELRAQTERGEAISVLIASEYPIYGRYGYGPATEHVKLEVRRHAARFRNDPMGSVELLGPEEIRPHLRTVFDAHRRHQPGEIDRPDLRLDVEAGVVEVPGRDRKHEFQAVSRRDDGTVDGYVRYRAEDRWEGRLPDVRLEVRELLGASPGAVARLWRYILGIDWVATVTAADRGPDDLLPYLLVDARAVREVDRSDFLWARILDPVAVLSRRNYLRDVSSIIEVVDESGLAGGRFRLEVTDGEATCEPTETQPDIRLPVTVLSAVILGGSSLSRWADAGWIEQPTAGALEGLDAALRWHQLPWCATWF